MTRLGRLALLFLSLLFVTACGAAIEAPFTEVAETTTLETSIPGTQAPLTTPTGQIPQETPLATPTAIVERRSIEVEWPPDMRLGDSDIIRLSLIPTSGGYTPQLEFEDHELEVEAEEIPYISGFDAFAIARMDAVGFEFSPEGDQERRIMPGQILNWRWSISPQNPGTHRLSLQMRIRWVPIDNGRIKELPLWDRGFEINVNAPFGVSASQARILGMLGILIGGTMVLPLAQFAVKRRLEKAWASRVRQLSPNRALEIDTSPGIDLSTEERTLLEAVYHRYSRLHVQTRFSSGYSGARTFLVQPVWADGRTDAYAIVKIGALGEIKAEFANYESFVRHTLPPITSRVQGPPVVVQDESSAALEYTFVGLPGVTPTSFRTFALAQKSSDSQELIENGLFRTFGTGWWMQRVPYTFRLETEYDRLLPVHLVLELTDERSEGQTLTGDRAAIHGVQAGDIVRLENPTVVEVRPGRNSATLTWLAGEKPAIRVRFQGIHNGAFVEGAPIRSIQAKVIDTRASLLKAEAMKGFPNIDLDAEKVDVWGREMMNPIPLLGEILPRRVQGTRSIIHGDLNLENILVGPGDLVWLIDFASTREGHTLFDFARLEVELTTQIASEQFMRSGIGPENVFQIFDALEMARELEDEPLKSVHHLLASTRRVARQLVFDTMRDEELDLALYLAYLGTLKFSNLDELPSAPMPKALAFACATYLLTKVLHSRSDLDVISPQPMAWVNSTDPNDSRGQEL